MSNIFRKLFGKKKQCPPIEDNFSEFYISRNIREVRQKGKTHIKFKYHIHEKCPNCPCETIVQLGKFNEGEVFFSNPKFPNRANGEKGFPIEIR